MNQPNHDAARALVKQALEAALREMLGEVDGPARMFAKAAASVRREQFVPYLQGRFDLDEALVNRFLGNLPEKWFVLQREGEAPASRQPLEELLEANRDDAGLCEWAMRAEPGSSYLVSGGPAELGVSARRVA